MRFVAAYPITPATELLEWMSPALAEVGGTLVQAEDELASVNMAIGGSYGGVPSLTATSGPGLSLMVEALGLVTGRPLPAGAQERLDRAADEEGAFRSALRALERRAHGERELGLKLERKGHTPEAVAAALQRLAALGLIDDVVFVRQYVQARAAKGRGPVRLRHDLAMLGIARGVIEQALSELGHWSSAASSRLATCPARPGAGD